MLPTRCSETSRALPRAFPRAAVQDSFGLRHSVSAAARTNAANGLGGTSSESMHTSALSKRDDARFIADSSPLASASASRSTAWPPRHAPPLRGGFRPVVSCPARAGRTASPDQPAVVEAQEHAASVVVVVRRVRPERVVARRYLLLNEPGQPTNHFARTHNVRSTIASPTCSPRGSRFEFSTGLDGPLASLVMMCVKSKFYGAFFTARSCPFGPPRSQRSNCDASKNAVRDTDFESTPETALGTSREGELKRALFRP